MKILITGANGMLGQDIVAQFSDHEVMAVDKNELDITDLVSVEKVVSKLKPEYIINAAAYTDVDGCETNLELCNKINGFGPKNLAIIAKKYNCVLIHYSTDYVFNGEKQDGYDEDYNNIEPVNTYGASKALGEQMIRENCEKYYILRISWLYGKHGNNFIDTMIKFSQEKDSLKVVNDQHGSPTYTADVAARTKEIIENLKPEFGTYHVANAEDCTWYEFTKQAFDIKKIKTPVKPCSSDEFPRPARRPKYSILLNTKLPAMRSWKDALKDYLR